MKTAIFDLDGTLIDTPRAIIWMIETTMRDMGRKPADEAAIRATIGLPLDSSIATLLERPTDHHEVTDCVARYRRKFLDWLVPQAHNLLFPHVADGLIELHQAGVQLAVATSKYRASADAILQSAGLLGFFTTVVGADEVARPKPHAETADLVLFRVEGSAAQSIVIGDTVHDIEMAHAAGIRSIAVTYGIGEVGGLRAVSPVWIADDFRSVASILLAEFGGEKGPTLS